MFFRSFLALFDKYGKKASTRDVLKLKTAVMLQKILDITRGELEHYQNDPTYMGDPFDAETRAEKVEKLTQVGFVCSQ
jgi:hypothetical protein